MKFTEKFGYYNIANLLFCLKPLAYYIYLGGNKNEKTDFILENYKKSIKNYDTINKKGYENLIQILENSFKQKYLILNNFFEECFIGFTKVALLEKKIFIKRHNLF